MAFVTGETGTVVRLGAVVNSGGEGTLYQIAGTTLAAKIRTTPPDEPTQEKLRKLVAACDAHILQHAAWPTDYVVDQKTRRVVGVVMPHLTNMRQLSDLSIPKNRKQHFPTACWDFLLAVARNVAAAFDEVHKRGFVVGDVNDFNVMVGAKGDVRLIDVDSFQLAHATGMFYCEVGVPLFTPPELQNALFAGTRRTMNHDAFGLAVLIFQLLFAGRHPFAGRPLLDSLSGDPADHIGRYCYAYAKDNKARGINPPKTAPPIEILTDDARNLFERAFTESGERYGRPSPADWVDVLDAFGERMAVCPNHSGHISGDHLHACPWCRLDHLGVRLFEKQARRRSSRRRIARFDREAWRRAVDAIRVPATPSFPTVAHQPPGSRVVSPCPSATQSRGVLVVTAVVLLVTGVAKQSPPALWFAVCAGLWALVWRWREHAVWRRGLADALQVAMEKAAGVQDGDCGQRNLARNLVKLRQLEDAHQWHFVDLKREEQHAAARTLQASLHAQLQSWHVGLGVPGFTADECRQLQAHQIWNAADVVSDKLRNLPPHLARKADHLHDWRAECREFFRDQQHSSAVDDSSVMKARVRLQNLEAQMLRGERELAARSREIARSAELYQALMNQAAEQLALARFQYEHSRLASDWTVIRKILQDAWKPQQQFLKRLGVHPRHAREAALAAAGLALALGLLLFLASKQTPPSEAPKPPATVRPSPAAPAARSQPTAASRTANRPTPESPPPGTRAGIPPPAPRVEFPPELSAEIRSVKTQRQAIAELVKSVATSLQSATSSRTERDDLLRGVETTLKEGRELVEAWDDAGITLSVKPAAEEGIKVRMLEANMAHTRYLLMMDQWHKFQASSQYRRCLNFVAARPAFFSEKATHAIHEAQTQLTEKKPPTVRVQ